MNRLLRVALAVALTAAGSSAHAAWYEAKSAHFLILADESPRDLEQFALKLERFDKAVRLVRAMDDPPLGDAGRLTVFVLKDTDTVSKMAVGTKSPIYGFYIPKAAGSVAFVPRRTDGGDDWDLSADTVFFHEYAHHLMLQNTDSALPPWLVEGFAEFFSTAQFPRDGSVQLGTPANHRAPGLYLTNPVPIEKLLGEGLKDKASDVEMDAFYGRAWLLTHYLTFSPKRDGQLAKYVEEVRAGKDLLTAARDAFGDLKKLDGDIDDYLQENRFRYLSVKGDLFKGISAGVRPLGAGEAAIMPVRIRSSRGVDDKTAPEVAAQARAIAASYPDDPAVETALAEAEFDEHNYAASEQAANRALSKSPALTKALVYKGRAEMELAAGDPKADWNAIRNQFIAANKLDTEDPEPLLLFYESFGRHRQPATADAIAGLEYALVLAPQDQGLREMVVWQLIVDNHLAEAREALGPLAFNPHSSDGREQARKVMAALAANNRQAALDAMRSGSKE